MKISSHITYKEATNSKTALKKGIKNRPNRKQLKEMVLVATKVFEPLRHYFNDEPIKVTSFFRSRYLNLLIGGSTFSQHCKGQAIDIKAMGTRTNSELFYFIKNHLEFDQLIWEFGDTNNPCWVHVSYRKGKNRGQVLKAYRNFKGKTKYIKYSK